jgi:hypothetical protein
MELGSWNMTILLKNKIGNNNGLEFYAEIIVLSDMLMCLITEKRISDTEILIRIPDVIKDYLKGQFILDFLSNLYILMSIFTRTTFIYQFSIRYVREVKDNWSDIEQLALADGQTL